MSATNLEAIWRKSLIALALLLVWLLLWYRDTALGMVAIWSRSDTYAHGFFVPLISLWLIWRRRQTVGQLTPAPAPLAWFLMLGFGAMWLLGDLVAVNAATQLAFTSMLVLAVPALLGWQVSRALMFPLIFVFFAVPIGDFMMPQLMEWTADFTVLALRTTGIPVYREGQQFVIPSGNWSVVEACSGIRYLIASVTVGSLFAYLSYSSNRRRLVFIVVSFLVPIVANWLRAYIIVMLGHYSGNKIATGVDHLIYGWLFFGIVIMIMFMIGARWAEPVSPEGPPLSQAALRAPARAGLALPLAWTVAALVCASPQAANWELSRIQNTRVPAMEALAPQAGWKAAPEPSGDWQPAFVNPSGRLQLGFVGPQAVPVGLYLGYYRNQNYERKLVSSENMLVTTTDLLWARTASRTGTITFNGQPLTVRSAELRSLQGRTLAGDDRRLTVWQFYWVNGRLTSSDALAKIYGALGRLTGQGDDGAVVILYAPKISGSDPAIVLQAFVDAHATSIEAYLQNIRNQR